MRWHPSQTQFGKWSAIAGMTLSPLVSTGVQRFPGGSATGWHSLAYNGNKTCVGICLFLTHSFGTELSDISKNRQTNIILWHNWAHSKSQVRRETTGSLTHHVLCIRRSHTSLKILMSSKLFPILWWKVLLGTLIWFVRIYLLCQRYWLSITKNWHLHLYFAWNTLFSSLETNRRKLVGMFNS